MDPRLTHPDLPRAYGEERPTGLTTEEAARALAVHGPNALPAAKPRSVVSRVLAQLRDPMILLLIGACVVTISLGDMVDTAVILAVIVLNTAIGVVQEVRAERALAALDAMAAPTARARRDGVAVILPAADLVPDDVIELDAGDIVPADGVVLESYRLLVDEAAMTGESVPVLRPAGEDVSSGTVATAGRAVVRVTRTGAESALGQIAAMVAGAPVRMTPLQRRLARLSRDLVIVAGIASALVFVLGLLQGRAVSDMLVVAVSLAVAAVPESLPAVVSVALALGAYRMAKRSAIVRGLPAVETLGSVTVIASDKTGTLTEGRMLAERIWTPRASYVASGTGYNPDGSIAADHPPEDGPDTRLGDLLRAVVLCNDARLLPPDDDSSEWTTTGDPLEGALLALATKGGLDLDDVRARWPRTAEAPFDSEHRWMTTHHRDPDGDPITITKGAPETVLDLVSDVDEAVTAQAAADAMARQGYRVIAVVAAPDAVRPSAVGAEAAAPDGGVVLGLVGILDPARSTAEPVVSACRDAGVRVVMVTGDHPDTAHAVASSVGITADSPALLRGDQLGGAELDRHVQDVGVFARTRPEQKVDIVRALQRAGHVVAVTGDGVNDAPALRAADIGVAMGRGGTEVARQAADLVLADDDLRTVVTAIEEGRRILANIRAFLRYAISGGLAEVCVMVIAPFLGMPIPLLPAQILWINMLTHGVPGVAFGAEPLDPRVMHQPSASPDESVLGGGLLRQIMVGGALIAAVSLAVGVWADANGESVTSHVFAVLGFAQLAYALALRAPRHRGWRHGRSLELAVAISAALQLAAIYAPPLQSLLKTESLDAASLAATLALAVLPAVVVRLTRRDHHVEA